MNLVQHVAPPMRLATLPGLRLAAKCLADLTAKIDTAITKADSFQRAPLDAARAMVASAADDAAQNLERTIALEASLAQHERALAAAAAAVVAARNREAELEILAVEVSDKDALARRDAVYLAAIRQFEGPA